MITKILNWLTGMHWSSSPHGVGCVHEICRTWQKCRGLGICGDFAPTAGQ